jgi:SMI1-KNR4 cell-wall
MGLAILRSMKATPQTIWRPPAYLSYLQPTLTPELVAQAEQWLGVTLPAEYLALLEVQNGGYIRYGLPDLVHSVIRGIGPHYPNLLAFDWDYDDDEAPSFPLEGLIPFDGDGHWHLCLDYRSCSQEPAIAYIDVECDDQREIAPSFAEYLALLEYNAPSGLVLLPVAEISALIATLEAHLKITFEPPNSWNHGYPVYRALVGTKAKPECIWLSPNNVPRGFIRESDRRYSELRDLLPGTALRFPELPPESYLLETNGERQSALLAACAELGLAARPAEDYLS